MEDELEDSPRKTIPVSRNRSFINKTENESFFQNTSRTSDTDLPKFNSTDETLFQKRSRTNRMNVTDEIEYETQNLALKNTMSTESLTSRGSRNFSRHSPLGSFRSLRNSTRKESERNGINIIMVIGFATVIAFGYIFNKIEIFLRWFHIKLNEIQSYLFGGNSIKEYYAREESLGKKILYCPIGGLYFLFQILIYVFLKTFEILKKPAPKALVTNVFTRYINE